MCSAFFMVLLHLVMIFYTLIYRRKRAGFCGLTAAKVIIFTNIDVLYAEFFANDCGKGGRGTLKEGRGTGDEGRSFGLFRSDRNRKRSTTAAQGPGLGARDEGREISDCRVRNAD
jgi:hypothetical protein